MAPTPTPSRGINRASIAETARSIQIDLWKKRSRYFPNENISPLLLCTPEALARYYRLELDYQYALGSFGTGRDRFVVAGALDRPRGIVSIATEFGMEAAHFTGVHEFGHYALHEDMVRPHRDRPVYDHLDRVALPIIEREANYFAACIRMPERLVLESFETCFGRTAPLIFSEAVAFELKARDLGALLYPERGSLDRGLAVAKATRFAGKSFRSLANQFGVSHQAMAIRLFELSVVTN